MTFPFKYMGMLNLTYKIGCDGHIDLIMGAPWKEIPNVEIGL